MGKVYLRERLTHKYRDGYSELDRWDAIGTVKVLAPKRVREPENYDDGGEVQFRVIAPAALATRDLSDAIYQEFSGTSCQHEHDCCGCALYRADVTRVARREYSVVVSKGYNY